MKTGYPKRVPLAKNIARLERIAAELDDLKRQRIFAIHFCRGVGMTNEAIGEALGISEAAVRAIALRHPEESL